MDVAGGGVTRGARKECRRHRGGNVLYGGAPHWFAAAYALLGWYLVLAGTGLVYVSLGAASRGGIAALLPLPFVIVSFSLATRVIRMAAEAIRSVLR